MNTRHSTKQQNNTLTLSRKVNPKLTLGLVVELVLENHEVVDGAVSLKEGPDLLLAVGLWELANKKLDGVRILLRKVWSGCVCRGLDVSHDEAAVLRRVLLEKRGSFGFLFSVQAR